MLIDIDDDGDLDMVLIDEVADVVILERNGNGPVAPPGAVPANPSAPLEALRVAKGATTLELTWGPSCRVTDTDFAVYSGAIGSFGDHDLVTCTTGGVAAASMAPGPGSQYFLVVPLNEGLEGSYGTSSSGAERPAGAPACHPQLTASCP